jgi:threonine/homoserine/homoserine lactone efflux protein
MDIINFPVFALAVLALHALPGPDSLYVVGQTVSRGVRAGALAALGITVGCLTHTLVTAFGFAALLNTLPGLFDAIRVLGALYLIYQGVTLLVVRPSTTQATSTGSPGHSVFFQALLTNVLNPKVALFYLAFFPQFVAAHGTHKTLAYLLLGAFFAVTAGLWALSLAAMAGRISGRINPSGSFSVAFHRVVGVLFAAMGIRLIV